MAARQVARKDQPKRSCWRAQTMHAFGTRWLSPRLLQEFARGVIVPAPMPPATTSKRSARPANRFRHAAEGSPPAAPPPAGAGTGAGTGSGAGAGAGAAAGGAAAAGRARRRRPGPGHLWPLGGALRCGCGAAPAPARGAGAGAGTGAGAGAGKNAGAGRRRRRRRTRGSWSFCWSLISELEFFCIFKFLYFCIFFTSAEVRPEVGVLSGVRT